MTIDDYIGKGESVICNARVKHRNSVHSDTGGELACTEHRLVFFREREIIDISLDGITAIEYSPANWLNKDTVYGIVLLVLAAITVAVTGSFDLPAEVPIVGGFAFLAISFAYLWEGLVNRYARIKVHTPTESYNFVSKEYQSVEKVPHAIRKARLETETYRHLLLTLVR